MASFGARVLEPSTGVLMHNRGSAFSLAPGHPNELAGGKRPSHTLMPLVVERDGALAGVLGTMGGKAHPQFLAQVLLRLLSGSDPAAAVGAPRWVVGGLERGQPDTAARAESGLPAAAIAALATAGMPVTELPWPSDTVGHAHAIWLTGGSCGRAATRGPTARRSPAATRPAAGVSTAPTARRRGTASAASPTRRRRV